MRARRPASGIWAERPGDVAVAEASDAIRCGPLWVSPGEMYEARLRGRRLGLSIVRLRILAELLRAGGRVVSRSDLYTRAAGEAPPRRSRAIDVHIARIRKALGPFGRFILTVPGIGYRADVVGLRRAR